MTEELKQQVKGEMAKNEKLSRELEQAARHIKELQEGHFTLKREKAVEIDDLNSQAAAMSIDAVEWLGRRVDELEDERVLLRRLLVKEWTNE